MFLPSPTFFTCEEDMAGYVQEEPSACPQDTFPERRFGICTGCCSRLSLNYYASRKWHPVLESLV